MRCVKITDCDYDTFEAIRDAIFDEIPFALVNQGYSPKKRIAIFNFWDRDYISAKLEKYILQPPLNRENVPKLIKVLEEILK